jgi:DNA polymerase-3 subunit gamma/tau
MLLKGLLEVRDATRPVAACEMALIRLAYAADLPPTDKLVRDLLDGPAEAGPRTAASTPQAPARAQSAVSSAPAAATRAKPAPEPTMSAAPKVELRTLQDLAALAQANGAPVLKVNIENNMRLVKLEAGVIEFTPTPAAPRTLAGDLSQKLKDWTGVRWSVSIVQGGAPTLAEQKQAARTAKFESVTQEPLVRAVLDRFRGAEIKEVRALAEDDAITEAMPEKDD